MSRMKTLGPLPTIDMTSSARDESDMTVSSVAGPTRFPLSVEQRRRAVELLGESIAERIGVFELPESFKLSVVVPVFNERETVARVVDRLQRTELPLEIILVDDGSTDGTREHLKSLGADDAVQVIYHERNRGKGAAIRSGFAAATGDVVVIQDADLEYDPFDFWWLLQPIVSGRAEVVYGSRYSQSAHPVSPYWHRAANQFITWLTSVAAGWRFTDVETCYKMIRRDTLQAIQGELREDRFGIEIELTFRLARQSNVRIFEVPIRYDRRTYAQGKKITWRDGIAALWCIAKYAVRVPRRRASHVVDDTSR